jgi:hypothetical protein
MAKFSPEVKATFSGERLYRSGAGPFIFLALKAVLILPLVRKIKVPTSGKTGRKWGTPNDLMHLRE